MLELPRGPIWKTESDGERPNYSGGYAAQDKSNHERSLESWRDSAREEALATANLNAELDQIPRYIKALSGEWYERRRARYKSNYFDNALNNTRQTNMAMMTDSRPVIDVGSSIEAYKQQAEVAGQLIRIEWLRNDMDLALVRMNDIADLNGTAFWKVGAASPGMMQVLPCGPDNVMPIQPGDHIQSSSAVLYQTWKRISWFRTKFPFNCADLERESSFSEIVSLGQEMRYRRPYEIPEYTWNGLSPAMQRVLGTKTEPTAPLSTPFRSIQLQEYYVDDTSINESKEEVIVRHPTLSLNQHNWWYRVKPGERLYPRKRLIIYAGRKLMHDGPAPYWHGMYPFACYRPIPTPWSFWGLSVYRDLLPLNMARNEIGAGIMDMIRRALNPQMLSKMNAVPPAAWNAFYPDLPGGKLLMNPLAQPGDFRYLDPPNIPAWVLQFDGIIKQEYGQNAGILDMSALSGKKQAPGGDTIQQMRDGMNATQRLRERFLEVFLRDAGIQAVSNVFQFYELPMRLVYMGDKGQTMEDYTTPEIGKMIPDGVPKEDFWRIMSFAVSPGTTHGGAKDRDKQVAIALAQRGLLPVKELYRRLEMPNANEVYDEWVKEKQMGLAEKQKGRSPDSRTGRHSAAA